MARRRVERGAATLVMAVFGLATWTALEVPSAVANGGETIATAPQLPLDQFTASGYVQKEPEPIGGEYWRVEMPAGALLTFDGTVTSTCGDNNHHPEAYVYVYAPSTTDFTRRETSGVTDTALNPNGELRFTAPYSGDWLLEIGIGGASCGDFAYTFTAKVQKPTYASLMAPSYVRPGKSFFLAGVVAGTMEGSATIQLLATHRHWKTLASNLSLHDGTFRWKTHAIRKGRQVYRLIYNGDSGHLPASAQRVVTVR